MEVLQIIVVICQSVSLHRNTIYEGKALPIHTYVALVHDNLSTSYRQSRSHQA